MSGHRTSCPHCLNLWNTPGFTTFTIQTVYKSPSKIATIFPMYLLFPIGYMIVSSHQLPSTRLSGHLVHQTSFFLKLSFAVKISLYVCFKPKNPLSGLYVPKGVLCNRTFLKKPPAILLYCKLMYILYQSSNLVSQIFHNHSRIIHHFR